MIKAIIGYQSSKHLNSLLIFFTVRWAHDRQPVLRLRPPAPDKHRWPHHQRHRTRQPAPRNITHPRTPEHPVQIRPQQPAATQTDTAQSESHPARYPHRTQLPVRQPRPAGEQKTQQTRPDRLPL